MRTAPDHPAARTNPGQRGEKLKSSTPREAPVARAEPAPKRDAKKPDDRLDDFLPDVLRQLDNIKIP